MNNLFLNQGQLVKLQSFDKFTYFNIPLVSKWQTVK